MIRTAKTDATSTAPPASWSGLQSVRQKQPRKRCYTCKKRRTLTDFGKDAQKRDGYRPYCKDCERAMRGREKMPPPIFTNCAHCSVRFRVQAARLARNRRGKLFCCKAHQIEHGAKDSGKWNTAYRPYILDRDGHRCVLCGSQDRLHIHHIQTRGSGGSDEYHNLVTLCGGPGGCHTRKAHGIDGARYRVILSEYTARFTRPADWDEVLDRSGRDREVVRQKRREAGRKWYQAVKNSERYKLYREKLRTRWKERDKEYKAKYGVTYMVYRARMAKERYKKKPPD